VTTPSSHDPHRRVTITVPAWVASLRDPGIQVLFVLGLLAVVAFAMLAFGWRGAARTPYVPLQLPWLVSAGLAGLGLLGFVLASWSIHLGRRQDAANRAAGESLVREAAELAEDLRSGRRTFPGRR